jgi:hypothetical protein
MTSPACRRKSLDAEAAQILVSLLGEIRLSVNRPGEPQVPRSGWVPVWHHCHTEALPGFHSVPTKIREQFAVVLRDSEVPFVSGTRSAHVKQPYPSQRRAFR